MVEVPYRYWFYDAVFAMPNFADHNAVKMGPTNLVHACMYCYTTMEK